MVDTDGRPPCFCRERGARCDAGGCELGPAGVPFDPDLHCRVCWLYHNDPQYRWLWDGAAGEVPPRMNRGGAGRECADQVEGAARAAIADLQAGRIPEGARVVGRPAKTKGGPGTELMALLRELGFKTCGGCQKWARRMNELGIAGCREHRAEIVARLRDAWKSAGWGVALAAAARAVAAGTAFRLDPRDVPGSLLDEAIRRVEEKGE